MGGGEARIERQHAQGKLTARERIELLLDPGTFVELDKLRRPPLRRFRDGRATRSPAMASSPATARSTAARYFTFAQDFTVFGGSLSGAFAEKICKVMDLADEERRARLSGLNDGAGARIQEGVVSLGGYGEVFTAKRPRESGVDPPDLS